MEKSRSRKGREMIPVQGALGAVRDAQIGEDPGNCSQSGARSHFRSNGTFAYAVNIAAVGRRINGRS